MLSSSHSSRIRKNLLRWYDRHHRVLPWRAPELRGNAYATWVSEIMLQQTRVAVVVPYFQRFLARFPILSSLARAPLSEVLRQWSGLGYYRRARQLHAGAQWLLTQANGEFPRDFAAALQIPGVGAYTARAVLSIAYGQAFPAVDGNVRRVLQRLSGRSLSPARLEAEAQKLLSPRRPGDFNQALMELGALICLPARPQCSACPLRRLCRYKLGARKRPGAAPPRSPAAPVFEPLNLHYGLLQNRRRIWLTQRPSTADWMPELWELPAITDGAPHPVLLRLRHSITRYRIDARVYAATRRQLLQPAPGAWFLPAEAATLPLTGLTRKILRRLLILKPD